MRLAGKVTMWVTTQRWAKRVTQFYGRAQVSKMGRQAKLVNEYVLMYVCVSVCIVYMEAMFSL